MAFTGYQTFLAVLMVFTGSINTLSTKWADMMSSVGSNGVAHPFNHPYLQATSMFFGEFLCLLTFKILYHWYRRRGDGSEDSNDLVRGNRVFNRFILYVPALCDMIATSTMYVGLNLTYASSFQMLRGSVIIFVALLSVALLGRRLSLLQWIGILGIILGLGIVGLADFGGDSSSKSRSNVIIGDVLIILAQIITAIQMVYEERFVGGKDIPSLQAVGLEGMFGFFTLGLLLWPMYYIPVPPPFDNNPHKSLEDAIDGLIQIKNNGFLALAISGTVISIAFFNFAGISVTKEISATTRMVLDSVRTVVIWGVSILLGWETFKWMQVLGFISLLLGMCLYNNIVILPAYHAIRSRWTARNYGNLEPDNSVTDNSADDP